MPIHLSAPSTEIESPQYEFHHSSDRKRDGILSFSVKRRIDGTILFDTSQGGLVLNNQFLQIVTRLQSVHVYGFGENNHDTLKHHVHERKSWGLFARDQGNSLSARDTRQSEEFPSQVPIGTRMPIIMEHIHSISSWNKRPTNYHRVVCMAFFYSIRTPWIIPLHQRRR